MDPFSVTTGALAVMGVCVSLAHAIKTIIEKTKMSKPILIKLLDKVEHVRLYLGQLRSISARLTNPEHMTIMVPFDRQACEITMRKLTNLVDKIGGAGDASALKVTISWIQNKRVAEDLAGELEDHQKNISHALLALAAHSSVVTRGSVEELVTGINDLKIAQNPFQELETPTEDRPSSDYAPSYSSTVLRMWPAHITRDHLPQDYLNSRDRLADAAYGGEWDEVFHLVESARVQYYESWMNAARLKQSSAISQLTLWNPLHQAAFLGAPAWVVRQMIDKGGFRTLRTAKTSADDPLPYLDMTACEIARAMGYHDLFDILAPVVLHSMPFATMERLQQQLHWLLKDLIRHDLLFPQLRLPELSVFTELENPVIWFPVFLNRVRIWTFQCCLDGRELLVLATYHGVGQEQVQSYRISEARVRAIEEPLATNT